MEKKTAKRTKKSAGAARGPVNSQLKATVVSREGEHRFDPISSAIDSARRTFSLPRTLISKGRTQFQTLADTRYGTTSLSYDVSQSTGGFRQNRQWLPRPLKRMKFGILSILVIIGLSIGMLSATSFSGPYQSSVHSLQAWAKGTRLGQILGLNGSAVQEKAPMETLEAGTKGSVEPPAFKPTMRKKISDPVAKSSQKAVKSKAKSKAKVSATKNKAAAAKRAKNK